MPSFTDDADVEPDDELVEDEDDELPEEDESVDVEPPLVSVLDVPDDDVSVDPCALVSVVVASVANPVPHAMPPARTPIVAIPETNAAVVLMFLVLLFYQANFSA